MTKPSETPYLRFGGVEPPFMGHAVEIVGNARGLPGASCGSARR